MGVSQRAFCHTVLYNTMFHRTAFAFSNKDMISKLCLMDVYFLEEGLGTDLLSAVVFSFTDSLPFQIALSWHFKQTHLDIPCV